MFKFIQRQHLKLGRLPHILDRYDRNLTLLQRLVNELGKLILAAGANQKINLLLFAHLFGMDLNITAYGAHQSVRILPSGLMDLLPALAGGCIGHSTSKNDVNVSLLLKVHRLITTLPQRLSGTFRLVGVNLAAQC